MPETSENWLGLVNSCVYYACQTREIYQVLAKYSFIWNKEAVNISNDH